MACPVCDHTMEGIVCAPGNRTTFWCPRCGTIKENNGTFETVTMPRHLTWVVAVANVGGKQEQCVVNAEFSVYQAAGAEPRIELRLEKDGVRYA